MNIDETLDVGMGQSVEIGTTENGACRRVVRKAKQSGNGIEHDGPSAEIPIDDIEAVVRAVAERDLLGLPATARILACLAASIERRTRKFRERSVTLDELMAGITDDNLHEETDSGPPQGKEVW